MRKLGHSVTRLGFGAVPQMTLVQQEGDQGRLEKQGRGNRKTLPAILLEEGRLAQPSLAAFRETGLADVPALHLFPVEQRLCLTRDRRNILRALAAENARCEPR